MRIDPRVTLWAATIFLMAGCTPMRDPLQDWLRQGYAGRYRPPAPAESAALAAAFARGLRGEGVQDWDALGFEVRDDDRTLAVREREPRARGWGSYAFRSGAARPLVLQAPHGESDRRTDEIAFVLFTETNARAYAVNAAHRALDGADQANAPGSPFAQLGRAAAHPGVDATVVQVHGYGRATAERHRLGASTLVVSDGTRDPAAHVRRLAACLADAGFDARLFPAQAPYPGGTRNAVRAAMAGQGAGRFIHLELGEALRDELVRDRPRVEALAACL